MRILFLSPRQCRPPVSGAKLREYHLARALGRHASITHVFFAEGDEPAQASHSLPFCVESIPVPRPRRYTPVKLAKGLVGRWPLPIVNYTSREMWDSLARVMARGQFDLAHIDSIHMAAYAPLLRRCGGARVVYDWHNIESELMQRYSSSAPSWAAAWYASVTARRLEALEKRILMESFGHLVCSERERDRLRGIAPDARIAVIENGVDARAFREAASPELAWRIVFVGSMGYRPNVEGAVWFARNAWPAIHRRFPHWRLTLVGSDPAPAVIALRELGGVEVTGAVEDVRPYYREALAAIVPLRTGGGTRLKILEAMAAGTPVVSTALGAEGLAITPGVNSLLAETPEEWLAQLAALSAQGELWHRLSCSGRELARSRYDWELLGESLYKTYLDWTSTDPEPRPKGAVHRSRSGPDDRSLWSRFRASVQ